MYGTLEILDIQRKTNSILKISCNIINSTGQLDKDISLLNHLSPL